MNSAKVSSLEKRVLNAVASEELAGMQIAARLKQDVSGLYPIFRVLEKKGLLSRRMGEERPAERNGHAAAYYKITEAGTRFLKELPISEVAMIHPSEMALAPELFEPLSPPKTKN